MTTDPHIEAGEAAPLFGPGTRVKIKDLLREVNAGLDRMKIARQEGQGNGWGWRRHDKKRGKFLVGAAAPKAVARPAAPVVFPGEELWANL